MLLHFLGVDGSAASPPEAGGMTSTGNGSERKHTSLSQCQENLSRSRGFLFEGANKISENYFFSKTFLKIYFTFVPTCLWFLSRSVKGTKSLSSVEVECAFALTKAIFVNIFDFFFSSASSPLSRTESSEE